MAAGKKKGLTLIEVLITAAILSLVGVAIYSMFANGLAIWKRARIIKEEKRSVVLSLEKITANLRNAFNFSKIPFEGDSSSISFAAMIKAKNSQESLPGQITYTLDFGEDKLYKEERTYSEFLEDKEGRKQVAAVGVKEVRFSFCYLDNSSGDYKWKDDWKKQEQDSLPWAVRLKLVLKRENGQDLELNRMIVIPVGTGKQEKTIG
ncbi:MAG: prepilin-type N-terminal cleavage/methylation domain-containing protein [Candidatus Omnitrophica bacterium]|nr:prepilin-type N-terminal cleavage/methylation domain-containing protein [Candidatus Omnitrophota bacterium]MCF7878943.1 prepilin-type N-terminal cleavage/methylation domain-containing protein [Candidatus Omnitrophota bacterium]